ncbi:LysR substrate-binding domain-containing protein, partial [Salmonella enterica]|uniref:LysR substrate-binding domain-containing protein n=1 Tax=Salmonella enterica TaxID=28901 RepID=UPI003F1DDAEC
VVGRVGGRALQLQLNYQVLYTETVWFVESPKNPLAAREQISWSDLAHLRWIFLQTGTPIRISIDISLVDKGFMLPENT